ncbi:hypothetical protein ACFL6U_32020, partial [Planctomycetota bacterium]
FREYGQPVTNKIVKDLHGNFDNRVLLQRKSSSWLSPGISKIHYHDLGLLFWFKGNAVNQIVIHQSSKEAYADNPMTVNQEREAPPAERIEAFEKELLKPVTVSVSHSPDSDRLSVQYAVIAVCQAAAIPYNWDKSARLVDPLRRRFMEPVTIENQTAYQALREIVQPIGLSFGADTNGVYLCMPQRVSEM